MIVAEVKKMYHVFMGQVETTRENLKRRHAWNKRQARDAKQNGDYQRMWECMFAAAMIALVLAHLARAEE